MCLVALTSEEIANATYTFFLPRGAETSLSRDRVCMTAQVLCLLYSHQLRACAQ